MGKIYCIMCKKFQKFLKSKILCICYRTLLLSSICNKCGSEDEKIFMEQESIKY